MMSSNGNSYHSYSEQQCIGTNNKYLLRAAKMELLVADSINHPTMIIEKLQAYQRATEYFTNQQYRDIHFEQSYDVYSLLLQLCPYLCKFLVKTLSDNFEPIKLAGIKGLEFLIEYLGCTLGNFLPQILSSIFKTYPSINDLPADQTQNHSFIDSQVGSESTIAYNGQNNPKVLKQMSSDSNRNRSHAFIDGIGSQQQQLLNEQKNVMNSEQQSNIQKSLYLINFKIIIDMYHHLLESFLNVLASASSQILRVIFSDVIVNNLFKQEINPELKVYCIRIAEKILAICQGDIEVSPLVMNEMILLLEELNSKPNAHANLKFHVNKLWESLKLKFIYNMGSIQMNKMIEWIGDNLICQSENENLQNFQFLYHLLDITSVICYKMNGPNAYKRSSSINSSRNQKNHNLATQEKINTESSNMQNTQKLNSSQLLASQNQNQSQEYESSNVIMKFYYKLKNSQCALIVNQNELVNIQYLLKPLMLWIDNSLQYQTKLELFRSIWVVLIEVLISINNTYQTNGNPQNNGNRHEQNKASEEENIAGENTQLEKKNRTNFSSESAMSKESSQIKSASFVTIADIALPLLQKINSYIQSQQPNEKMLQFLIIITNSLLQFPQESSSILFFFIQFFQSYVQCIPHSIHDETFIIFDNLCDIITPQNFTPYLIENCINMLLDQYTVKGKAHRKSKDKFIQVILRTKQNVYQALQKLLFENQEILIISKKKKDTKLCVQMQELFSEKLSLVSEIFSQLNKDNFSVIEELIQSNRLQKPFLDLINSRNSKSRLKGLNILKVLFEQYLEIYQYSSVKPIQKLNRQDAYFIKLMLICLKRGLENERDSKLQFNALLILDQFFQHVFKGPNLSQEIQLSQLSQNQQKGQRNSKSNAQSSLEDIFTKEHPEIEFDSFEYLQFRSKEILKLWPIISMLIDSPWSNIRSIAYGIICYWVKDANGLRENKFMSNLINTLQNLLSSKESECRTGGLNILGSLCGLGFNFEPNSLEMKNNTNLVEFFRRNSNLIPSSIWEIVYDMQFDWDQTNQAASTILIQLCASKDCVKNIIKQKQGGLTFKINSKTHSIIPNANHKNESEDITQNMAQYWRNLRSPDRNLSQKHFFQKKDYQIEDFLEDQYVFWMPLLENGDIMELISMFKNEFKPPQTLWIERVNYNMEESKQEELEQNYSWIEEKQTFDGFKQFGLDKEEEILDFEDLGIIEIDDEEWNEYDVVDSDNSRRKIPNLKQKINNISPQLQIRDKSPSMRVLRKGKLQSQQNGGKETGLDSFSSRMSQSMEKDIKQQQKSPEKMHPSLKNAVIEEEAGEEMSSHEEFPELTNSQPPYSEVEQYLQIDDGENLRIIDELELMQFLRQNNFALQRPNGVILGAQNDDKAKKKFNQVQQTNSYIIGNSQQQNKQNQQVSQSTSQSSSTVGQSQNLGEKLDKYRPLTPPIFIDETPQLYGEMSEEQMQGSNNLQLHLMNKANSQQGNGNRQFGISDYMKQQNEQKNMLSFSKNCLLSQQKSEDYIYSDSAESDDYQDLFIKQQEFLFRQQKYQKSQLNNHRDIPNRPLSAKLKKEETISSINGGGSYNNFQGIGGVSENNLNMIHNFESHQSSSLPSIAQLAAGNNSQQSSSFSIFLQNKPQGNKPQLPQSASTKSSKQAILSAQSQIAANLNQNYSGKVENLHQMKNYQIQDESQSSDEEHFNILQSRYSSSTSSQKQAVGNSGEEQAGKEMKQNQSKRQDKQQKGNSQQKLEDINNTLSNSSKQVRYQSPPRPQSTAAAAARKENSYGYDKDIDIEHEQQVIQFTDNNDILSSPFDQNTDIVNLDSPARLSISPPPPPQQQSGNSQHNIHTSNFAQYQQLQSEYNNNHHSGIKSTSDSKNNNNNNDNNSTSIIPTIGQYYSNDYNNQYNSINSNNNTSLNKQTLQNNFINVRTDMDNLIQQDRSNYPNEFSNNLNNVNNVNQPNNYVHVGSNSMLTALTNNHHFSDSNPNQFQPKFTNTKNNLIQNGNLSSQIGNSFEDRVDAKKEKKIPPFHQQQSQPNNSLGLNADSLSSNSFTAAQGSTSYLQNAVPTLNNLPLPQDPQPSQSAPMQQLINAATQITHAASAGTFNPKFISDKININSLVSVPSNYKSHFGTSQSTNGAYPNNHHILIQNQTNSSNSNNIFNSTLNGTIPNANNMSNSQNYVFQQQNNTLVSHGSTGNLFKNTALNNSNNYAHNTNNYAHTLNSKQNNLQLQSSRSNEKLLKKLMVKNIDFDDLKSVWKMNSEIKNISQYHNQSHNSANNNHNHNQSSNSNTAANIQQLSSQQLQNQHQIKQNNPIYQQMLSNQAKFNEDYQNYKDAIAAVTSVENYNQYTNLAQQSNQQNSHQVNIKHQAKTQRSNSLGRSSSRGVILASNLLTPLAIPITAATKSKKDGKKKKTKKKNEKAPHHSSSKNIGGTTLTQQTNILPQTLSFTGTTQSQQNTSRNHHQIDRKLTWGSNLNTERSSNNPENNLTFKKIQSHFSSQNQQINNQIINSPQRKSQQSSPSQNVQQTSSIEKCKKKVSKNQISSLSNQQLQANNHQENSFQGIKQNLSQGALFENQIEDKVHQTTVEEYQQSVNDQLLNNNY